MTLSVHILVVLYKDVHLSHCNGRENDITNIGLDKDRFLTERVYALYTCVPHSSSHVINYNQPDLIKASTASVNQREQLNSISSDVIGGH